MSGYPPAEARPDRHSADAKASVNAPTKKDGAGGKYTMGKLGEDGSGVQIDKNDPMYDSDADEAPAAEDTIFDKIIRGEIPSKKVFEDKKTLAFHDVNPQAPTHIVVIPKARDGMTQLRYAKAKHEDLLGHMMLKCAEIAKQLSLKDYRLVINDGEKAGQTVYHLHIHILAGRDFAWPPA